MPVAAVRSAVATKRAPAAAGPYSQGISVGEFVFVSGQLPLDPVTGAAPEGVAKQTAQSLANIEAVLAEAGCSMADVVKTTVFLTDMDRFGEMNEVYATAFPDPAPARSAYQVSRLPKAVLVEIEAIAVRTAGR